MIRLWGEVHILRPIITRFYLMQRGGQNPKMQKWCLLGKKCIAASKWPGTCHVASRSSHHQPRYSLSLAAFLSLQLNPQAAQQPYSSHLSTHCGNSEFQMDKTPQAREEGLSKEVSDQKPSKLVSDYILPHILNLYSHATPKDFEIYAPNATFEDPLMCAHGMKQIKSAFYSLAKIFSESRIVDYTISENQTSSGKTEILIDNKQCYKFLGKDINMISLIKLYTEDGKVVRHEDRWDKKPLRNRETVKTPLVGHVIEATRRASMLATHALMSFGKDPST